MTKREVNRLFKLYSKDKNFAAAKEVMTRWSQEAGDRHHLWGANMALLLLAIDLGLQEEAKYHAQKLEEIDAGDPYVLSLISSIKQTEGDLEGALVYAERAVENSKIQNDPNLESYREDLKNITLLL